MLSALYRAALARCERHALNDALELSSVKAAYPLVLGWDYEAHAPRPLEPHELDVELCGIEELGELALEEPLPGEDVVASFASDPGLTLELLLPLGNYRGRCLVVGQGEWTADSRIDFDFGVPEGGQREGWPTPLPLEELHEDFALEALLDLDPETAEPIVAVVTAVLDPIELNPRTPYAQFGFGVEVELQGADRWSFDEASWIELWSEWDRRLRAIAPIG